MCSCTILLVPAYLLLLLRQLIKKWQQEKQQGWFQQDGATAIIAVTNKAFAIIAVTICVTSICAVVHFWSLFN